MGKEKMNRRQMLRMGSMAAFSGLATHTVAISGNKKLNTQTEGVELPGSEKEICFMNASDMAALIHSRKISSRELMHAHLKQIDRINPKVNAFITRVPEDVLMAKAGAADDLTIKGKFSGPLHGLPIAVKDLIETKGIRTTYGSPLYKDLVPNDDALVVLREKSAGAIVLGKTNVPELGLGSQTFNPLFGPTFNPYDLTKTCGGSTGGGAVALACGMAPLSDGSDMGGSLRNPGSFCNVVGIRTSPGRIPLIGGKLGWQDLSVQGPMARSVKDCALLLSVQAGPDSRSPISIMQDPRELSKPLSRSFKGIKVALIKDFGIPWDSEVKQAVDSQARVFESLGCIVETDEPDMKEANECFVNFRHWQIEASYGDLLATDPDKLNNYTKWHIEEGRKLTGSDLSRLEMKRTVLYKRFQQFMEKYEFLVLPVSQVLPFDVNTHYPTEIAGVKMENYMDWMRSAYYVSTVGNPSISVPCAFSKTGLPIGMQIVGRHNAEFSVLQMAYAFETLTQIGRRRPGVVG
jgi:amidase